MQRSRTWPQCLLLQLTCLPFTHIPLPSPRGAVEPFKLQSKCERFTHNYAGVKRWAWPRTGQVEAKYLRCPNSSTQSATPSSTLCALENPLGNGATHITNYFCALPFPAKLSCSASNWQNAAELKAKPEQSCAVSLFPAKDSNAFILA